MPRLTLTAIPRQLANACAQLLWPQRCVACLTLVPPEHPFCDPCAMTLIEADEPGENAGRPTAPIDQLFAAGAYGGAMRDAILRLKHGRSLFPSRPLGQVLSAPLSRLCRHLDADLGDKTGLPLLLIPVPLHRARLSTRGFNQALEVARQAFLSLPPSKRDRIRIVPDALRRRVNTPPLGHLSPADRQKAVRGAFEMARSARIRDHHVALVDDVVTSGATTRACATVLKNAGAASVSIVCLAKTDGAPA